MPFQPSLMTVYGTVTGEQLLPFATLQWDFPQPPEYAGLPFTTDVPLSGSGTTRHFTLTDLGVAAMGSNKLTVTAQNTVGSGTDSVVFTGYSAGIQGHYDLAGGQAAFGNFRYTGPCGAVYDKGAIAGTGPLVYAVLGDIFTKWLTVLDKLGCPAGEEHPAPGGAKAQDFENGRIYAGMPAGAYYVPRIFVWALDNLGERASTGLPGPDPSLPLSDPSSGPGDNYLFQRFTRPGTPVLPTTLEIKGTPPQLWVERPGDDLSFLKSNNLPPDKAATVVQLFPCDSYDVGSCDVKAPPALSSIPPGITTAAASSLCGGHTFPWGPNEWVPVGGDDYKPSATYGFVADAGMAHEDFCGTHECISCGPGGAEMALCILLAYGACIPDAYNNLGPPADWDMNVVQLYLNQYRFTNYLREGQDKIESEYEDCWAARFHQVYGAPSKGDLLFVSGRWIVDCGHDDYHAEIHPPAVVAFMRTDQFELVRNTHKNCTI